MVGILLNAGMVIIGTFINVFLIRATEGNISLLVARTMIASVMVWVAFVIGSKLLSRISITMLLRLGVLSFAVYFLSIVVLHEYLEFVLLPLSILDGFGGGLNWFATSLLIAKVISDDEQGRYFGYQQTSASIFGVMTPAIAGFIITLFTDLTGYYVLFGVATGFFLVAIYIAGKIEGFTVSRKLKIKEVMRLKGNRHWEAAKLFRFVVALKETVNGQVFMLFAFLIFHNEGVIGNILSMTALITIVSSFWFAKIFSYKNQRWFFLATGIVMMTMYLLLAMFPIVPVLIASWIVFALVQNWSVTILQALIFQLTKRAGGGFEQNDYLAALELPTTIGRVVGMIFALVLIHFINSEMTVYRILFVVIAVAWILEYFIIELKVKWLRYDGPIMENAEDPALASQKI